VIYNGSKETYIKQEEASQEVRMYYSVEIVSVEDGNSYVVLVKEESFQDLVVNLDKQRYSLTNATLVPNIELEYKKFTVS
jgi:hypothetical protein